MKIKLTKEELVFLRRMGIGIEQVFDASRMSRTVCSPLMKSLGAVVSWGLFRCQKRGHKLKDRHGHCVMCNPSCLAHAKRFQVEAIVYLAYSSKARLVKVGFSHNLDDRLRQMNRQNAAGVSDWIIFKSAHCTNAGRVEYNIQHELTQFKAVVAYSAKQGSCKELFRCDKRTATKALTKALVGA